MYGPNPADYGVKLRADSVHGLSSLLKTKQTEITEILKERVITTCGLEVKKSFDGIWSQQTRKMAFELRAVGLQLDALWAQYPPDWVCPCCKRSKAQILYVIEGDMIAKLAEHHDHFDECINHAFRKHLGDKWSVDFPGASDVQKLISSSFRAFDNVVICESCNLADRDAKRIVAAHLGIKMAELSDFSFAIDEVRQFFVPVNNVPHAVIESKVIKLFTEKRKLEILNFRRDAVEEQAKLIGSKHHWRSPEHHPDVSAEYEAATDDLHELGIGWESNFDFFAMSATTKGRRPLNHWRRNRYGRVTRTPSEVAIKAFIEGRKDLKALGTTWRCPCCRRSVRKVVRFSNLNRLFAKTGTLGTYGKHTVVCMECSDVAAGMSGEAGIPRDFVTVDDVFAAIAPVDHDKHPIKSDLIVDQRIAEMKARYAITSGEDSSESDRDDSGYSVL